MYVAVPVLKIAWCNDLVLEGKDRADAAIDGVGDACLRLVADRACRVPRQQLRHVAGAEHPVHGRELRGAPSRRRRSAARIRTPARTAAAGTCNPRTTLTPPAPPQLAETSRHRRASCRVAASPHACSTCACAERAVTKAGEGFKKARAPGGWAGLRARGQ